MRNSQQFTVYSIVLVAFGFLCITGGIASQDREPAAKNGTAGGAAKTMQKVVKSDEEWRKQLTSQQFDVARKKGTEPAFTGAYWNLHDKGVFKCVCCGADLFDSEHKFDSGTGWPSFWAPLKSDNVETHTDYTHGMTRTEVLCKHCDAHLGHVFEDGPAPTHLRYCINSASLKFEKK